MCGITSKVYVPALHQSRLMMQLSSMTEGQPSEHSAVHAVDGPKSTVQKIVGEGKDCSPLYSLYALPAASFCKPLAPC